MIQRTYSEYDVSDLTLEEVNDVMQDEHVEYSADYGFEVKDVTTLKISLN
jgi:hypothetical protein